jgi:hypothetical protein
MITPDISTFSSLFSPAFTLIRRYFRHYATPMTLLMPFSIFLRLIIAAADLTPFRCLIAIFAMMRRSARKERYMRAEALMARAMTTMRVRAHEADVKMAILARFIFAA